MRIPAHIIDRHKRRKEEKQRRREESRRLPLMPPSKPTYDERDGSKNKKTERKVIVIEM